jgi:hypothetical protein
VKLLVLVPVLACLAMTGCSDDPQADYCQEVEDHQVALSDIAASEDAGALFQALDAYDDLAAKAPRDIADDWAEVIDPLRELQQVLADNGVDVSTYSAEEPPPDLEKGAREEIEAAARTVGSEQTVEAMAAVEQHALDVCGTPLSR